MDSKKCLGCGISLQNDNILQDGYTTSLDHDLCQRCFRLKNYGDYKKVTTSGEEFLNIVKDIGKTKDLVLYVCDIINLDEDLTSIRKVIDNKMILVINKIDVFSDSISKEKLLSYFDNLRDVFQDVILVSSNDNYNIDYLLKRIKFFQTSSNVYVIGNTNAGKSSLINQIIKNHSTSTSCLTMSMLPSTTLDTVKIEVDSHLTIIDTPGLIDKTSLINNVDTDIIKKLSIKEVIKPKIYQLKKNQSIIIDDLVRIDYVEGEKNSFCFYLSNKLNVRRIYNIIKNDRLKDLKKVELDILYNSDIVIKGLGFIKVSKKGKVNIYLNKEVEPFIRKSLV